MNIIFRSKNKIMTVAVVIGALVLSPIQPVFAQPLYKVEGNSVDKAAINLKRDKIRARLLYFSIMS